MLLITELQESVQCVTEAREDGKGKNLFIEGTFMQYNNDRHKDPNRNHRLYPEETMRKEVSRYVNEVVNHKRAYGELNHPSGPQINLDRVSHMIEKLDIRNDGTVYGRAKIVDTPMGNIVRGLLEGGANLGVSCRALGSVKEVDNGLMEVQQDWKLITAADVVADPSANKAFVNGIMENVEWFFDETKGSWFPEKAQEVQKTIKTLSKSQLEEQKLALFERFLKTL